VHLCLPWDIRKFLDDLGKFFSWSTADRTWCDEDGESVLEIDSLQQITSERYEIFSWNLHFSTPIH
jgi:hypothetical protein